MLTWLYMGNMYKMSILWMPSRLVLLTRAFVVHDGSHFVSQGVLGGESGFRSTMKRNTFRVVAVGVGG
jgi:hypothetical protein